MRRIVTAVLVAAVVLTISGSMLAGAPPDPPPGQQPASDPLVRLLQAKGVLSVEEAQELAAVPAMQQRDQLTALLLKKGVISTHDLQGASTSNERLVGFSSSTATLKPAVLVGAVQTAAPAQAAPPPAPKPPAAPAVIPAIAPIRVLQLESAKPGGLVPDIKLGSGAKLKLYGFLKASVVHDTSSQQGNDFPLPQFLGDTGPNGSPEFHIKARAARVGFNFEWPDIATDLSLTGRLEFDFEGNFTRSNNRNISSIRSSQPSIRLAWMRLDKIFNPKTSVFLLVGQDWTPFGSSTLPNLLETTALGIGFGSLYERAPQVRFGVVQKLGGSRNVVLSLEPTITLPAFGNLPTDLGNQLGYGERQGVDSQRPQVEARAVLQFQLDKAKGVAPAQIIFSGMQGARREIVIAANVPALAATNPLGVNFFKTAFPRGAELDSNRYGLNASIQLPTRWFTLLASGYQGEDLRWFFAGQIFSEFNVAGPTNRTAGTALDGTSVLFGTNASCDPAVLSTCTAQTVPQRGVRAVGGFLNLGLPLSRLANADPKGRNAGWTLYLHYGLDNAYAKDVRLAAAGAGARWRSDLGAVNLQYKMNSFVTFGYEASRYSTRSVRGSTSGTFPLAMGVPQHEFHDLRSELATIFTF